MLAEGLKVNTVLTDLNLANNQLCGIDVEGRGTHDAAGIIALAKALKVNAVLTNLNLADNQLCGVNWEGEGTYDATGITALAETLKVNAVLTKLECVSRPKRMPETPETKPETLARNKHGRFLARHSTSTGCSHCAPRAAHPSPWTTCAQSSIQQPQRLRQARHQRRREARARALPLSLHRAHSPLWDGTPRTTTATATSA